MTHIWRHRKAVLSLVFLLCAVGAWYSQHLPVAIFPQLVVPRIIVAADAGDIPIVATLNSLTRPLEAEVSTVPGVTKVLSTATRGSTDLDITFDTGTDMQLALQRMQSQVAEIRSTLPAGANVTTALINPSIFPIMGYSLTSDQYSLAELRNLALYTLRPRLARLPGVAQMRITGGDVPEYLVAVRPEALMAHGLTLQDVQDALARANAVSSVGVFDRSYQRYEILVSGLLHSPEDIAAVTVASRNSVPIAIADLATVQRSIRPRTVLATGNGKPAVVVNVIRQPAANTVDVAAEVRSTLDQMRSVIPRGVTISLFYDQSEIVRQSESSVVEAISIGGALALIVLMLFLGNVRAACVVLLLLPLTLLITFSLMKAMGQTLNIMTLGAIAIALGLVIDDGIVVVEDIFVGLEKGLSRRDAIARGLRTITPGMLGSSFTTMAAFLPLTFLGDVTGQFFAPLAWVMMATLLVSLVLSLILTPVFAEFLLPARGTGNPSAFLSFLPHQLDRLGHGYARFLTRCLQHRRVVLVLILPLLVVSGWLYTHVETGFFPEFDEGAFVIDYFTPPGTSLAQTDHILHQVEDVLAGVPEVAAWSRLTGARSGSGLELCEPNQGDILVRLKVSRQRGADEIMDSIRKQLESTLPAFKPEMAQMLQDGIGDIARPEPIEVKIFGEDQGVLQSLGHQVGDIVGKVKGVVDESDGIILTGPEAQVHVDSARASRYGLSTADVTAAAGAAIRGTVATTVQDGEVGIDVRVQAARGTAMLDSEALPDVLLAAPGSPHPVRLQQLASIVEVPGGAQLNRENQQPMVSVTARLEGRDLGSAMRDVQEQLAALPLPMGYRIEYGGLYASQQQSFAQLAIVLLLAVMLISTLLLIQFRSYRQVIALMVAALLSQSGVLVALFVTHTALNISSFTGAIMIIGVITENGIFMFDTFNVLRASQATIEDAMVQAGRLRLRPILMTKIGAILAMVPLAMGFGAGAAMQQPLAIAVVGGLVIAAVFTLIVAPTLYVTMAQWDNPVIRLWNRSEEELESL